MLNAIDSPYIRRKTIPTPFDTVHFLRICSSSHEDIIEIKPTIWDKIRASFLFAHQELHQSVALEIINYVNEYSSPPRVINKETGIKKIVEANKEDIPSLLVMQTAAMFKLNMSEDEALNAPIGRLAWYGISLALLEGVEIKLISTEKEEMAEMDRLSIIRHEQEMRERLLNSMKNGIIPKRSVKVSGEKTITTQVASNPKGTNRHRKTVKQ